MDHSHQHTTNNVNILKRTSLLMLIEFVAEFTIWLSISSVSIVSDSLHTLSALWWVGIAFFAIWLTKRPSNRQFTFGYHRAEIIGALLNWFLLLAMAIYVIIMWYQRFSHPIDLPTWPMIWVACGAIVLEAIGLRLSFKSQKNNLNMRGAYWHIIQTFVWSLMIIVVAIVIKYTWFTLIDPIIGVVFGIILIGMSWWIIKQAMIILMEATPSGLDIISIEKDIVALSWVINIHHVHAWMLTSQKLVMSMHVKVMKEEIIPTITQKIHDILKSEYNIYFSTIQCEGSDCLDNPEAQKIDFSKSYRSDE